MQKEQIKTLLINISIVIVIIVVVALTFLYLKSKSADLASGTSVASRSTAEIAAEITRTENILKDLNSSVVFSLMFFRSPAFESLENFPVTIPAVALGRENPFLPTKWKIENDKKADETKGDATSPFKVDKEVSQASQASVETIEGDLFGDFNINGL